VDQQGRSFRYNSRNTLLNASFLAVGCEPEQWLSLWPT